MWPENVTVQILHRLHNSFSILVICGALKNIKCSRGKTPLHEAVTNGHKDIVELLLKDHFYLNPNLQQQGIYSFTKNEVNINANDMNGMTPFLVAVHFGHLEMVKFLLQSGANINAKTYCNTNAMNIASSQNHKMILKLLIDKLRIFDYLRHRELGFPFLRWHRLFIMDY